MTKELIHEQDLIDSFIQILDQPANSALPASNNYATGNISSHPVPSHIESRLPAIFNLPLGTDGGEVA